MNWRIQVRSNRSQTKYQSAPNDSNLIGLIQENNISYENESIYSITDKYYFFSDLKFYMISTKYTSSER